MTRLLATTVVTWVLLLTAAQPARAQAFDVWLQSRIDAVQIGTNGQGADKQHETPSGDSRSTSLVDSSSATDFVSAAVNLATVATGNAGSGTTGSQTVTASLYALLAGLNGKAPTDPQFYKNHVNARRASFTIGTAVSDLKRDNTEKTATVVGVKILLFNGRELYTAKNLKVIADVQKALKENAIVGTGLKDRVQRILFSAAHPGMVPETNDVTIALFAESFGESRFADTLRAASADVLKAVDAEIVTNIASFVALRDVVANAYDSIQQGGQFAVLYNANLRPDTGFDNHRAEFIFDYGLSSRVMWTANGSWDYLDKKAAGSESSGRVAMELSGDLTSRSEGWSRQPIRVSVSGQVMWADNQPTAKDFQVKLSLPVNGGMDIPLVYRYSNATARSLGGGEAKIGFTIDLSRLAQAVK